MAENRILSDLIYQPGEGSLRYRGVRYLLIRPETLAAMQDQLAGEIGPEGAGEIFFAGGFTGGQLSGRKYKQSLGLSDREAVEFMCRMGSEIGWGNFRLLELDPSARRILVEVDHSPFSEAYGTTASGAVCHLIRGVLAGLGSGVFGTRVVAEETACTAQGDIHCRFEILGLQDE